MARIVNEEEHAARRNQILDAAQRLVYTKGYEQMTIQDILDDLGISKGAFYHYFDSKTTLLEALVERMVVGEVLPLLNPIVENPQLSALEKLHAYFDTAIRWKTARKSLMLSILKIWIADENAIFRQKLFTMTVRHVVPLLTDIIRQGVTEGVFKTSYPGEAGRVIVYILLGLSDTIMDLFMRETDGFDPHTAASVATFTAALNDAMERVLGAPSGTISLIDPDILDEWFAPAEAPVDYQ